MQDNTPAPTTGGKQSTPTPEKAPKQIGLTQLQRMMTEQFVRGVNIKVLCPNNCGATIDAAKYLGYLNCLGNTGSLSHLWKRTRY